MRSIKDMTHEELVKALTDIRDTLYMDAAVLELGPADETAKLTPMLNGEKEANADTLAAIDLVFVDYDMKPPEYIERDVDTILLHYMIAALWSSIDEQPDGNGGPPMDDKYGPDDITDEAKASMRKDIVDFLSYVNAEGIDTSWWNDEQLGHDFWLTRNHHGAGFWDRGQGEEGDALTKIAHSFGSCDLYVGDDGKVHCE